MLLFHRIARPAHDVHRLAISPDAFRSQLEALSTEWRIVPLSELAETATSGKPPDGCVALTFDDGYLDNLEVAAPILEEYRAPATFFLTSEPLNRRRRFWWDALEASLLGAPHLPEQVELRLDGTARTFTTSSPSACRAAHDELYLILRGSSPARRDDLLAQLAAQTGVSDEGPVARPMTSAEAQRLCAFPLIEIGAHTVHHVSLPVVSLDDQHREILESRSALERVAGRSVTLFAYPFGHVSPEALRTVMEAGFAFAAGAEARAVRPHDHRWNLPRVLSREESGAELDERLRALK